MFSASCSQPTHSRSDQGLSKHQRDCAHDVILYIHCTASALSIDIPFPFKKKYRYNITTSPTTIELREVAVLHADKQIYIKKHTHCWLTGLLIVFT